MTKARTNEIGFPLEKSPAILKINGEIAWSTTVQIEYEEFPSPTIMYAMSRTRTITAKNPKTEVRMFPASMTIIERIMLILNPRPVARLEKNVCAAIKTHNAIAGVKSKEENRKNLNRRKMSRYGSQIWHKICPNFEYSAPGNQVSMTRTKQRIV